MKALVLKQYGRFAFEDVPAPEPGPDEVLVAVHACGICGSDVHGMDGSTGRRRPPIIMGHEAAGTISRMGRDVTAWAAGDRVTFDSTIYCGECEFCRRGLINLCDRRRVLGVSCEDYRRDGAFAEFVAVPQHILYRLPERLTFEQAALVEPFAIALHAIRRSSNEPGSGQGAPLTPSLSPSDGERVPKAGEGLVRAPYAGPPFVGTPPLLNDTVVVIGAGMIGLALVQALRQTGCGKLIAVDTAQDRLSLAAKLGATHTLNPGTEDAAQAIQDLTHGMGADLAFEAVGVSATVDLAVRSVRKGAAVTLIGNVAPKVEFPLQVAVTRELTLHGSCASQGEYPACLEMLARGDLDAQPLISATAPLAEGAQWFERLYRKEPGLLKVVLKPALP
ncbi:MAG TPA: galactitol-1-phosphate 5-dehydrogenase [Candidatus Acidoferrum sp.]|nr:galactitol-1-phosphate 5-dehydrogenase [Candidatus Acidoferrum sp.]